jgi:hypothetical protein
MTQFAAPTRIVSHEVLVRRSNPWANRLGASFPVAVAPDGACSLAR